MILWLTGDTFSAPYNIIALLVCFVRWSSVFQILYCYRTVIIVVILRNIVLYGYIQRIKKKKRDKTPRSGETLLCESFKLEIKYTIALVKKNDSE